MASPGPQTQDNNTDIARHNGRAEALRNQEDSRTKGTRPGDNTGPYGNTRGMRRGD